MTANINELADECAIKTRDGIVELARQNKLTNSDMTKIIVKICSVLIGSHAWAIAGGSSDEVGVAIEAVKLTCGYTQEEALKMARSQG